MNKFFNWLFGKWWYPDYDKKTDTWGIAHPIAYHVWSHGMTKEEAERECYYLNHGMKLWPKQFEWMNK